MRTMSRWRSSVRATHCTDCRYYTNAHEHGAYGVVFSPWLLTSMRASVLRFGVRGCFTGTSAVCVPPGSFLHSDEVECASVVGVYGSIVAADSHP